VLRHRLRNAIFCHDPAAMLRAMLGAVLTRGIGQLSRHDRHHASFTIQSDRRPTFEDVTDRSADALASSGVRDILLMFSQHTTCSVLMQASDDVDYWGAERVQDLVGVLEQSSPPAHRGQYRHHPPAHRGGRGRVGRRRGPEHRRTFGR
jgi:hypothetical protein